MGLERCEETKHYEVVLHDPTRKNSSKTLPIEGLDMRDELIQQRRELVEGLVRVPLEEAKLTRTIQIGLHLDKATQHRLTSFLRSNMDVFTWLASYMPDKHPDIMVYRLTMDLRHRPFR